MRNTTTHVHGHYALPRAVRAQGRGAPPSTGTVDDQAPSATYQPPSSKPQPLFENRRLGCPERKLERKNEGKTLY